MKRDHDLIRNLLFSMQNASPGTLIENPQIDGYSDEVVAEHAVLLIEAGFAEGQIIEHIGLDIPDVILVRLTWTGHEFLGAAADPTIWQTAVSKVVKPAGSWTFTVLLEVLKDEIKRRIM